MSLIKIIANNTELHFIKETLTIKKENNALSQDFKVAHSQHPFLIIENENCKKALGTRDITSINKKRVVEVTVIEGNDKYYGELQILSYLKGYRKCNLKFSTEVLKIINKQIGDFMPVVSVIPGETNPVPFTEKCFSVLNYFPWGDYGTQFFGKSFPAIQWQFPMMSYKNRYGANLDWTDPWGAYQNSINAYYEINKFSYNIVWSTEMFFVTVNSTEIAPQVYLLTPLLKSTESIGFKLKGSFYNSSFIRKILMLSTKTQTSDVSVYNQFTYAWFNNITWSQAVIMPPYLTPFITTSATVTENTTVTVYYKFILPLQTSTSPNSIKTSFRAYSGADEIIGFNLNHNEEGYIAEGEFDVKINPGQTTIDLRFYSQDQLLYTLQSMQLRDKAKDRILKMQHPTIELARYLPNWTLGTYLNELKKLFNLDITINDFKKEITLDFINDTMLDEEKVSIPKSLFAGSYDQFANNAFIFKYDNDIDPALYITKAGAELFTNQEKAFTDSIESKFKFIPSNGYTAELSKEVEDKGGVGLMIYDPAYAPFVSEKFEGKTLKLEGAGGIYETYYKLFLKFRLNASLLEVTGPFSEVEINKINKLKKIYIDGQAYMVASLEYSETEQNNYNVKLQLESINY